MARKKARTVELSGRITAHSDARGDLTVINEAAVLEVMQGLNPWWRGSIPDVAPFRRTAYHAARTFLDDPQLRRAILLSGVRRVGKSTILRQMAAALVQEGSEPESICYLDLSAPALRTRGLPDLLRLYHRSVLEAGRPAVLLLDEIQYAAEWDLHLKQLVDHRPEYRVVATGSASLEHRRKLSESGVGRWVTVHVPALSFWEYLQLRGASPDPLPPQTTMADLFGKSDGELVLFAGRFTALQPLFGRYLLLGGFPEVALLDNLAVGYRVLRDDIVDKVLKADMATHFAFRNTADVEKLFVYLCMHSGGVFSPTECANALGSTKSTVYNYLQALQEANLIYEVPPFRRTGKKALKSPPKVYLADAALRNAILLKGEHVLADPGEMGMMAETTVLRHLLSRYQADTPEIGYWQGGKRGREVDFIVHTPAYTIPVEVKYRSDAALRRADGLADFCLESNVDRAYWVTQREEDIGHAAVEGTDTQVLRIPAHVFCYLLGQAERLLWTSGN